MSLSKYTGYKTPFPVGVKLPEIKIEKKYYEEVSCGESEDNYQFLRKLCFKRLQQKGINKLDNAQVYYDRLKEELVIFQDLGFVDYILLNWDIINFCVENDIPTGAGRGSAAGSLVLFVIGVTHIDRRTPILSWSQCHTYRSMHSARCRNRPNYICSSC